MNLASLMLPAMPITPALFTEPTPAQVPTSPINFLALFLAPPEAVEVSVDETAQTPAASVTTPTVPLTVASPQQIAQSLIRSMLSPVAPLNSEPEQAPVAQAVEPAPLANATPQEIQSAKEIETKELPKKESRKQESSEPLVPSVVVAPQTSPMPAVGAPQQPVQDKAKEKAPLQAASTVPAGTTVVKTTSDAPVAFELHLTPATAAEPKESTGAAEPQAKVAEPESNEAKPEHPRPEHPQIQRTEAPAFERKSRQTPMPEAPIPAAKHVQTVAEVPAIATPRETAIAPPIKPSVPEALAASMPIDDAKPAAPSAPVHELAMRVSAPDSSPVDVRVSERGGEVHVAVHTADTQLRASLQSDLGSLVGKLEQSGFRTDARIPEPIRQLAENNVAAHALTTHSTADLSGSGTYGEAQDTRGDSNGRGSGSDPRNSDPRQQHQQQHRRPSRAWEEMMEDMQ